MYGRTFEKLSAGVSTGYGSINDGTDVDMVHHLKNNVKVLAAFKANRYRDDMVSLLVDEKNQQRTWGQFLKEAKKVDANYNKQWLAAEYNMAIRQARGAKQWSTFVRDRDTYPNLEYRASRSANPRQKHQRYYGMILPIDHPFWMTGYPPSDWGCKCWVSQTKEEPFGYDEEDPLPAAPKGIAGNPGIEKKVFTASHSYLSGLDKKGKESVRAFIREHADLATEEIHVKVGKNKIVVPIDADIEDLVSNVDFLKPFVKRQKLNWGINSHSHKQGTKNPELNDHKGRIGDMARMESDSPQKTVKNTFAKLKKGQQLYNLKSTFLGIDFMDKLTSDNYFDMIRRLHGNMMSNPKVEYVMLKNGGKTCIVYKKDNFETKLQTIKKELL